MYPELFKLVLCTFSEVLSLECLSITVIFNSRSVDGLSVETVVVKFCLFKFSITFVYFRSRASQIDLTLVINLASGTRKKTLIVTSKVVNNSGFIIGRWRRSW